MFFYRFTYDLFFTFICFLLSKKTPAKSCICLNKRTAFLQAFGNKEGLMELSAAKNHAFTNNGQPPAKRGISGSTLKMIAVITMFIDHFAAAILSRYMAKLGLTDTVMTDQAAFNQWTSQNSSLYMTYFVMRMIGRIAFPIYCFLLIEGFEHTRNRIKYAGRLLLFAAISEIPFDLLFNGHVLEFGYQNVFFTLFFGLVSMMAIQYIDESGLSPMVKTLCRLASAGCCMFCAQMIYTDYAAIGIFCILVLYFFRKNKKQQVIAGCVAFLWEFTAPLAFVPIWFYNGARGWKLKYFFYLFYPLHLLLLYIICTALGIVSYPAM